MVALGRPGFYGQLVLVLLTYGSVAGVRENRPDTTQRQT
jgi:hypothetical protein